MDVDPRYALRLLGKVGANVQHHLSNFWWSPLRFTGTIEPSSISGYLVKGRLTHLNPFFGLVINLKVGGMIRDWRIGCLFSIMLSFGLCESYPPGLCVSRGGEKEIELIIVFDSLSRSTYWDRLLPGSDWRRQSYSGSWNVSQLAYARWCISWYRRGIRRRLLRYNGYGRLGESPALNWRFR